MKKVLLSLAATLVMVAGFTTDADAQRRGGAGFYRGTGGGFVAVRSGGGRFVAGRGFRRAGFVAGPGFRRAGFVAGPRWIGGRRWVGGPRWWGGRRFVRAGFVGAGFVGAYPYYAGYYGYGGCRRWRVVATPWGPQWRLVNVCYAPIGYYGYGYGYGYGYRPYPIGFYGAVW